MAEGKKYNPCHDGTCDGPQRFNCAAARICLKGIPEKLEQMNEARLEERDKPKKDLRESVLGRISKEIRDSSVLVNPYSGEKAIDPELAICIIYGVLGIEKPEEPGEKPS
jgi:hypothetical protein